MTIRRITIIIKKIRKLVGFGRRLLWSKKWPNTQDGKLLLHIGCGGIDSPEFVNIDAQPYPHVHVIKNDITNLDMFTSGTVDLVYMCHILEHLTAIELSDTLSEMYRVLKKGAILRISVPDFDKIIEIYKETGREIQSIMSPLLGSHINKYDIHHLIFNKERLHAQLMQAGFSSVRVWDPGNCDHHDFEDWASKLIQYEGKEYAISLNLEGIK